MIKSCLKDYWNNLDEKKAPSVKEMMTELRNQRT